MIKLISFKNCPFVQRVMGAMISKDIPFEIEYIELSNKPQWFLDISLNGQVPVLVTEDKTVLFESDAIVEYLDDKYAPLADLSPEQKALDRAWSYQASKHYMLQCSTMASKNKSTFEDRFEKLAKVFNKAELQLGYSPYFKGDTLSNVDIAWLPLLYRAHTVNKLSGFDMLENFPKVKQWQLALMATGLPDKTVPQGFVESFSQYYLTNTYLSRLACINNNDESAECCSVESESCCV